jgi:hypothetical protein
VRPGATLVVWNATRNNQPPSPLIELAQARGKEPGATPAMFIERRNRHAGGTVMRLGALLL